MKKVIRIFGKILHAYSILTLIIWAGYGFIVVIDETIACNKRHGQKMTTKEIRQEMVNDIKRSLTRIKKDHKYF